MCSTAVRRLTRGVVDPPYSCFQQEHWCHLGRHWFLSWGGNVEIYRNRECCPHCRDRAVAKLEAKLSKFPIRLLTLLGVRPC